VDKHYADGLHVFVRFRVRLLMHHHSSMLTNRVQGVPILMHGVMQAQRQACIAAHPASFFLAVQGYAYEQYHFPVSQVETWVVEGGDNGSEEATDDEDAQPPPRKSPRKSSAGASRTPTASRRQPAPASGAGRQLAEEDSDDGTEEDTPQVDGKQRQRQAEQQHSVQAGHGRERRGDGGVASPVKSTKSTAKTAPQTGTLRRRGHEAAEGAVPVEKQDADQRQLQPEEPGEEVGEDEAEPGLRGKLVGLRCGCSCAP
jgi:hypothetical protein